MRALLYKSTGSWYQVKTEGGELLQARIKGKLKIDGITSTNPVAVGDFVLLENSEEDHSIVIAGVEPRINYVNRVSPHNKHQQHIVAANVDQSLLFATLKNPKTSLGFIDRFCITCEAYHIPAVLVFNKADVYGKKEMQQFEEARSMYESAGYAVYLVSVEHDDGLAELKDLLLHKTTLLSGHSGVGKSSFINHLFPDMALRTREVSNWSGKGMHTTTFAEMFDLPGGGRIIDTPGIRELGLVNIEKEELSHYFPEMRKVLQHCKYNNCQHIDEPACAVKQAVNDGSISIDRYASYLGIRDSIIKKGW